MQCLYQTVHLKDSPKHSAESRQVTCHTLNQKFSLAANPFSLEVYQESGPMRESVFSPARQSIKLKRLPESRPHEAPDEQDTLAPEA